MSKNLALQVVKSLDRLLRYCPPLPGVQPLRGSFSAYARLRNGEYKGQVLYERQDRGPCAPGSVTQLSALNQHDFQPWPAFWTLSDDARLVGSMWHWRDTNDLLCREGVFGLTERRRLGEDRIVSQWIPGEAKHFPGAWTSIASNWGDGRNYFHWMLDSLTRLRIREMLPEPTRILLPRSNAPYIHETLELLGLSDLAECPTPNCIQPERYYFCSPTAMTGVWNPEGFNWLRRTFQPHFSDPGSTGALFLTRRGTNRIPTGLDELESRFRSAGFQIVDAGILSVREQIRLTSGATAIAGVHGAAMTNLLWAAPGTPVLEIFGTPYLNGCYEQISLQGGLTYFYVALDQPSALDSIAEWISVHILSN